MSRLEILVAESQSGERGNLEVKEVRIRGLHHLSPLNLQLNFSYFPQKSTVC